MDGFDEEHLLPPPQRVTVQLVDEELVDMEVPPAELTLTSFNKLLSDLTFYSGVPDVQGLLIKTESGSFVQVFDLERIPEGNFRIQVFMSGNKQYLRIYTDSQMKK